MPPIRLLLVVADAAPENLAFAAWAADRLERPAFAPGIIGSAAVRALPVPPDVERTAWPEGGLGARRAARRILVRAAAAADAVVAVGHRALDAVGRIRPVGGVVVYVRTQVPTGYGDRQREAWWASRMDARWLAGPAAAAAPPAAVPARAAVRSRLGLLADTLVVGLGGRPSDAGRAAAAAALSAAGPDAVLLDLAGWGSVVPWPRSVAAAATAVAAADLLLLPDAGAGDAALLDAAMRAAVPVVASPAPDHVGRFRCPVEGFLVPLDRPDAWAEVAAALAEDAGFRQQVGGAGSRRTTDGDQAAREFGSLVAGTLVRRTGRCPVCPEGAAPGRGDGSPGSVEGLEEGTVRRREMM
ncbi:MAG: hypothetical protein K6V97_11570 [Actinomycetia bacterium]|nr:hypothetical protein [Actinomycetes bacterium]